MTLDIADVRFAYDEEYILEGIDLTVESGELIGLLGPNGSGKTTLLQCCNRLLEPDSGAVSVNGDRVSDLMPAERARRIGYVPQSDSRAFPASVFETILQGRRPHGGWTPGDGDREAVSRTIDRLGLDGLATRNVGELSGGQRQKVRLGRALVGDPTILLLDEPTSALDLKHRLEVMNLVVKQVRNGPLAGLLAIHDLNLAARYCDRVALLSNGRVHAVGEPDVLTPETVRAVYGVEASVREHRDRRLVVPEAPIDPASIESNSLERPTDPSESPNPVPTDD